MLALMAILVAASAGVSGRPASPRQDPPAADQQATAVPQAMISKYCLGCHNQRARVAGITLDTLDLTRPDVSTDLWERVIRKLRAETMPPGGSPRPDGATYRAVATWLENAVDQSGRGKPRPGRSETFHRLNRTEYQNAIRDLLSLDMDVSSLLPADNTYEHGFDNNADSLSLSPDLLARYMIAAKRITRLAVGISSSGPSAETYKMHPNYLQDDRASEELPFGSRGGIAIHHYFPVDGEYGVKVKLQRNFSDYILGFSSRYRLDVRLDDQPLKEFAVGGEAKTGMAPLSFAGNIPGTPEWEAYMNGGDAGLELRFNATAGPHILAVSFVRQLSENEGVLQPRQRGYGRFVDEQYDGNAAIEHVEVGGPYVVVGPGDTPSRREIFACRPTKAVEDDACATRIVSKMARRAYRRPVTKQDVDPLMNAYHLGRKEGAFDLGIQFALERLLIDPDFLYRVERDPANAAPGAAYEVSQIELASRLSFFLWSSIPDEPLLTAAIQGKLKDPAVFSQQVSRMLSDHRSSALVDNFASQWLRLRNLRDQQRESADYPDFDENLRESFRRETELFVASTIHEDRSVIELLSANYTFVNERLARHYGIPNVYGERFRKVTFPADSPRGGLLGQGSVLTLTSHPNRTSPVLRGKWLLESVLGAPPPPPPANIPGLPDRGEGGRPASVRERLELHRKNPVCGACHAPMDPLGFALENFDAIGSWRATSEAGKPIDSSGKMPSGATFDGPAGLRQLLLTKRDQFATTVTEKLLAYAVGRGLEFYDRSAVRKIVRESEATDYRWSSIIQGIVRSVPFQMRTAAPAAAPAGEAVSATSSALQ